MATATKAQEPETTPPTLEDVEGWKRDLKGIRTRLADVRETEEELKAAIGTAMADGKDVTDLQEERRDVAESREALETAQGVLERRIREGRETACRTLAETRIRSIRKTLGGLAGEFERKVDRAVEARDAYLAALRKVEETPVRMKYLHMEAHALARRFGLDVGELAPAVRATCPTVGQRFALERAGKGDPIWDKLTDLNVTPGPLVPGVPPGHSGLEDPGKQAYVAARALIRRWGEESPTPEILEALEEADGGEA